MKHNMINHISEKEIQLHCINTDSFVLSLNTNDIVKHLQNLKHLFDFRNLDKNHKLFSNKKEKVSGKFKIETPKNIWRDDFICLKSEAFSLKCNDKNPN